MGIKELKRNIYNKISLLPPWVIPISIVFIFRLIFYLFVDLYVYSDSLDYINFPFEDMVNLKFTSGRTPIYPIIIGLCRYIFGETQYLNFVAILQAIVSLIGVVFFYKACNILIKNKIILFVITLLYGFSPSIMGWDNAILTESFALSGTVVFIYYILKYINTPKFSYGLVNIILIFVLTFLRPTFLLFDVLLFVFWIFRIFFMKEERKILIKLSACSFSVFLFIGGYTYIFSKSHEIFSISNAIPRQQLYTVIERGYYKSSSDQAFIDNVERSLEESIKKNLDENTDHYWNSVYDVLYNYGNKQVMELNREAISKNIGLYIEDTLYLAAKEIPNFVKYYQISDIQKDINPTFFYLVKIAQDVLCLFKIGHAYLIILLELVVFVFLWIKRKSPPWIHIGIFTFIFSIVITTYIGTSAEYGRTMICILPFMYLSLAIFINWLSLHINFKKKLKNKDVLKI